MAFSKKCRRYFDKRNHRIKRLLEKTPDGYSKEDFHDLRLEIKKVKAFVAMLAHSQNLKEKKFLRPYKQIFKMAGQVRDAQMAAALLEKQRPLKWLVQYRHELATEAMLHEKEFYLAINENRQNDLKQASQKLQSRIENIKRRAGKEYLAEEKKQIVKIIGSKQISINAAHEMRKKLKTIGYVASLMKHKVATETKPIEEVQEALGEWHDHRQLAERLKKDALSVKDKQRKKHMQNLEGALNKKAAGMFGNIIQSLRKMKETTWKSPAKGEALLF